ncbi:hypothetical protein GCM10010433_62680 [Streptomyces pulveraceus]
MGWSFWAVREVLLRLEELIFLADPGIRVESVQDDGKVIRIGVSDIGGRGSVPRLRKPVGAGARLLPAIPR